jgi:hypothetical protein
MASHHMVVQVLAAGEWVVSAMMKMMVEPPFCVAKG